MKEKIKSVWTNPALRGTSIFMVGNVVVSGLAFTYHFLLARLLGPHEYGILAALFGLLYFVQVPINTVDFLITKLISSFEAEKIVGHTRGLISYLIQKIGLISLLVFPVLLLLSKFVQDFLKLPEIGPVIAIWLFIYLLLIITVLRAVLKAWLRFTDLVLNQIIEMVARLGLSVVFIYFVSAWYGWGLAGVILASLLVLFISLFQVREILSVPTDKFEHHKWPIKSLGIGGLVLSLAYTLMYSIDILLVKHFFSDYWTGIYAVLVTAGKVVYFAQSPLSTAIIPVVARKSQHPAHARNDLWFLLGISGLIGTSIVGLYFVASQVLVISVFSSKFIAAAPLMAWMGLAIFGYALANTCAGFLLALNKTKAAWISLLGLFAEATGIYLFHASLTQVVLSLGIVFGILALVLIIYSFYVTRPAINSSPGL